MITLSLSHGRATPTRTSPLSVAPKDDAGLGISFASDSSIPRRRSRYFSDRDTTLFKFDARLLLPPSPLSLLPVVSSAILHSKRALMRLEIIIFLLIFKDRFKGEEEIDW